MTTENTKAIMREEITYTITEASGAMDRLGIALHVLADIDWPHASGNLLVTRRELEGALRGTDRALTVLRQLKRELDTPVSTEPQVYLIAVDKWAVRDYLGFGFEIVTVNVDSVPMDGLVLLQGPALNAEWQAGRLQSGMLLRNADGRGIAPYTDLAEALEDIRKYAQYWR